MRRPSTGIAEGRFQVEIHAVTVRDKRTGEVTVAFPGTDLSEGSDWGRVAGIGAGIELNVYDQAEEYIRKVVGENKGRPVRLTGHSAGGTLAVEMGRRLDDKIVREVVGFQTPATLQFTDQLGTEWGGNEPQSHDLVDGKRIWTINDDDDLIGNFGARAGQPRPFRTAPSHK